MNFDENIKNDLQSAEQRNTAELPGNLNLLDQLVFLINNGSATQHEYVYGKIYDFVFEKNFNDAFTLITEFEKLGSGIKLQLVLTDNLALNSAVADRLILYATDILDFKRLIPYNSIAYIETSLITKTIEMCRFTKTVDIRLLGVQILTIILSCVEQEIVYEQIVPKIKALCQDTDASVRKSVVQLVQQALKRKYKIEIVQELMELMTDEEFGVRIESSIVACRFLYLIVDKEYKQRILSRTNKILKERNPKVIGAKHLLEFLDTHALSSKDTDIIFQYLHEALPNGSALLEIIEQIEIFQLHTEFWTKFKFEASIIESAKSKDLILLRYLISRLPVMFILPFKEDSILLLIEFLLNGSVYLKFDILVYARGICVALVKRMISAKNIENIKEKILNLIKWEKDLWDGLSWREYTAFISEYTNFLRYANFLNLELSFILSKCFDIMCRVCFIPTSNAIIQLMLECIIHIKSKEQKDFYIRRMVQDWKLSTCVQKRLLFCDAISISQMPCLVVLFKQCFCKEMISLLKDITIDIRIRCLQILPIAFKHMTLSQINECKNILEAKFNLSKCMNEITSAVLKELADYKDNYKPELLRDASQSSEDKRKQVNAQKRLSATSTSAIIKPLHRKSIDKSKIIKSTKTVKF
eukprot:NODE_32_length_37098_cov_1.132760.p5 type:complete len:643 gc:universal NODE_32_length_37098_cov_1.132760:27730-25802(-)